MYVTQKKTEESADINTYCLDRFLSVRVVKRWHSLRGKIRIVITLSYLDSCSELHVQHNGESGGSVIRFIKKGH
jgi:hypothetical protein